MNVTNDKAGLVRGRIIKNILDISLHVFITAVLSFLVWRISGSASHVLIVICGGVLIDLDHFVDYFSAVTNGFNLKVFFSCTYIKKGKVYLFLHSWELIACLFLLGSRFNSPAVFLLAFSLASHIAVDNVQRQKPLVYFFVYRLINKFDVRTLFPDSQVLFEDFE